MQERRQLCFDQAVTHFNMVADAATHSKKEMFVATLWSWQNDLAAYGDVQLLQPGDIVLPDEQDMTDRIALMAAERRLQRVATYRQLQAYSNILHQATGGRMTLDSLRLPANVHARPVQPDDVRVLREGDIQDRAFLYNKATQTSVQMLPDDLVDVPLLVLGLDQGSIGTAGQAYAEEVMQSMVHTKYDKFHRVIRDIKLSFQHSCNGIFLKSQLYSSYIWGVNFKPFGTGRFGDQKRRILNVFLATETPSRPFFAKYRWLIARDFSMPFDTVENQLEVWKQVATLPSCTQSLETPKLGRWFSWNGSAHDQMKEFHAMKMLLEFHLEGEGPDSIAKSVDQVCSGLPGFYHANIIISGPGVHWHAWILLCCVAYGELGSISIGRTMQNLDSGTVDQEWPHWVF